MYKHVVLWKVKSDLDSQEKSAQVNKASEMLGKLPAHISGITQFEVGINIGDYQATFYDFCLVSAFETRADFDNYCRDPVHNSVVEFIGSITEDEQIVDFENGGPQ